LTVEIGDGSQQPGFNNAEQPYVGCYSTTAGKWALGTLCGIRSGRFAMFHQKYTILALKEM